MIISILPFGVNKTEQVSSGQLIPKTLEYQAQIEYYMELQDIRAVGACRRRALSKARM